MDTETYERFFNALEAIVNEDGPAVEKAAALREWMGESEETLIEELISWFDKEE